MSLNVVGLISGGKDSLYSLAHCVRNGHKIIALANLYPGSTATSQAQPEGSEYPDLDSFMYQTVGHSIVPLYADALGIPLYRKVITGTATQNGRYYETSSTMESDDEIEDMYALVKEILERHPEINALGAGAILSTYQRTRVESVAVRLGLVPLAYLWQYPALPPPLSRGDSLTGLLDDMDSSRCDARIIKIASGGIPPNLSFSNIAHPSTRARLISGMAPFFADDGQEFWLRGSVLGEGGEYETLALDGPGFLWQKKIQIDGYETYEGDAGTVYTRLGQASIVQREAEQDSDLPVPVLMGKRFTVMQSKITASTVTTALVDSAYTNQIDVRSDFIKSSNTVQIFNLTAPGTTAAEQLDTIITTLPFVLNTVSHAYKLSNSCLAFQNIINTTLLLRSMEDFASVNHVYSTKLWPQGIPNPPARVTIAGLLPHEARVSISLIFDISVNSTKIRKGLHVQSRSYWAPANIGPYSQAVSVPVFRHALAKSGRGSLIEVVHLAGQIPLVPSTMSMLEASFIEQALLALQNLWRVAQERGVDCWVGAGVAYLAQNDLGDDNDQDILQRASQAAQVWEISHQVDEKGCSTRECDTSTREELKSHVDDDSDEGFDVWDHQQRQRGFGSTAQNITVGEHLHKLPNKNISIEDRSRAGVIAKSPLSTPPFIAAEVVGLPRNASIEWWSVGIAGLIPMTGDQSARTLSIPTISQDRWSLSGIAIENDNSGEVDAGEDEAIALENSGASTPKRRALCFFVILVIGSDTMVDDLRFVPRALGDLVPYLECDSESNNSLRYEVVTTKSFVNLSSAAAVSVHDKIELLRQSCIIPCIHLWSSQTTGTASFRESTDPKSDTRIQETELAKRVGDARVAREKDEIAEVAAAIVMRIDAFSE